MSAKRSRHGIPFPALFVVSTFIAGIAFSGSLPAAMVPDSKPKEWPADPTKHQVAIRRDALDDKQSAMIAAAEAAQPSREVPREAADAPELNDPAGLARPNEAVPAAGQNVWWYREQFGIRIPRAITAETVAYYADLLGKYGRQDLIRYSQPSSRLDYHAGVKFHKAFKIDGKSFDDVHVVTLKLTFSQDFVATPTEGMRFAKERVVILDAEGKLRHISGDGPTEVMVLAI